MYIFRNAMKNLIRNCGQNALMAAVFTIFITALAVCIIIVGSAEQAMDDAQYEYKTKVDISADLQARYDMGPDFPALSLEQYSRFSESQYLKTASLNLKIPGFSDTVQAVAGEDVSKGLVKLKGKAAANIPQITIVAELNKEYLSNDNRDEIRITEGTMYKDINECAISEELARLNGLSVGDAISVETMTSKPKEVWLIISGLYRYRTVENEQILYQEAFMDKRNWVFTGFNTISALTIQDSGSIDIEAEYFLKSPDLLHRFEAELRGKGLPDLYSVTIDEDYYNRVIEPVKSLRRTSLTLLYGILTLGTLIVIFLSSVMIKKRKHELGALRLMGMRKNKVAMGIVFETVLIVLCSLIIGIFTAAALAQPAADAVLDRKVAAVDGGKKTVLQKNLIINGKLQIENNKAPEMIHEIDVELHGDSFMQIMLTVLLLAAASGITAIYLALKIEPVGILMEWNTGEYV